MQAPSPYRFLERFKKLSPTVLNDDQAFYFSQYLIEIALLDASLLKYRASEIAAASLILASRALKKPTQTWNREMERTSGITEESLRPVVEDVRSFVVEVNPKFLTTLKYKFSKAEFMEVASIPFKF